MKRVFGILLLTILACGFATQASAAPFNYGPFTDGVFVGDELPEGFARVDRAYMKEYFYGERVDINVIGGNDFNKLAIGYYASGSNLSGSFVPWAEVSDGGFSPVEVKDALFSSIVIGRDADYVSSLPKIVHSSQKLDLHLANGEEMCAFFLARTDMLFAGFQIKAGDVLIGVERGYDEESRKNAPGGPRNPIAFNDHDYNDLVFVVRGLGAPSAVPVPAAVWLLGSGMAGLGLLRRRMK